MFCFIEVHKQMPKLREREREREREKERNSHSYFSYHLKIVPLCFVVHEQMP